MGRTKEPVRADILRLRGAFTMKQIAEKTGHSTRTVSRHLKELVTLGDMMRLDLRKSIGYPKNNPKVFYQINPFAGPTVPDPHISFYVRRGRTLGTIPMMRKGLTPLGKKIVDEKAWFSRTNPRYKIKRPWSKADTVYSRHD
jgi:predicted ArsR family transcriptional regulator